MMIHQISLANTRIENTQYFTASNSETKPYSDSRMRTYAGCGSKETSQPVFREADVYRLRNEHGLTKLLSCVNRLQGRTHEKWRT